MPAPWDAVPHWLAEGQILKMGRIPSGSNSSFVAVFDDAGEERWSIYKPRQGERPLWDFPSGTLCNREAAAWVVSQALGWDLVPPTVLRDGPYGVGSFQQWVDPHETDDYWKLRKRRRKELIRLAAFDAITNNADRKGEHCHVRADGRIVAIDNGLCFNTEYKVRTVLTNLAGATLPEDVLADLACLAEEGPQRAALEEALHSLIAEDEVREFFSRVLAVREMGQVPRAYPHWELYYAPDGQ